MARELPETSFMETEMMTNLSSTLRHGAMRAALYTLAAIAVFAASPATAWEPTKPVEFIVPAGTGGGADQMARLVQGVIVKHKLINQPVVVVNKSGGAGAE